MIKAAIYARYSSDLQRMTSIDDQVRVCRERIERDGGTVTEIYADAAISGSRVANRPELLRLLADARAGRFTHLYAEALDRLSRDQEDVAGLFKRLRHVDVTLITLSEGEISELHVGLKGTMNALFLKDLADKVRRGQRGRVAARRAAGGLGYGYDVVRNIGSDGEIERGVRKINEQEAQVIRRIFTEYAAGRSPRHIARDLNNDGIPSPRGGTWNASTINGHPTRLHGILTNPFYAGEMIYNRVNYRKDPETGRRQIRVVPSDQWVRVAVPELRIVDIDTWASAAERRAELARRKSPVQRRRPKHLLSGLIRCGVCGGAYNIASSDRMACTARREKGTCSNSRSIKIESLTSRVLAGIKERLLAPELFAEFAAEYQATRTERAREQSQYRNGLEREANDLMKKIDRIVDAIAEGTDTPALRVKLQEMEQRLVQVRIDIAEAKAPTAPELHPALPELYRRRVEQLEHAFQGDALRQAEAATLIRALIEQIRISPAEGRGAVQIELTGAVAEILAFAATPPSAGLQQKDGTNDVAIKVVPGAGIEPATLRFSIACSTN